MPHPRCLFVTVEEIWKTTEVQWLRRFDFLFQRIKMSCSFFIVVVLLRCGLVRCHSFTYRNFTCVLICLLVKHNFATIPIGQINCFHYRGLLLAIIPAFLPSKPVAHLVLYFIVFMVGDGMGLWGRLEGEGREAYEGE